MTSRPRTSQTAPLWALFCVVLACSGEAATEAPAAPPPPDPVAAQAAAQAVAASQAPPPPAQPTAPGALADLVFVWHGVGPLYQGFFTTQDVVTTLAQDLAPWVAGRANVAVHWDEEDDIGRIRLILLPGTLPRAVGGADTLVALHELAPLTTALARYRSALAARFDLRIESFRVELESVRGARACVIGVTGRPPPDGRILNPCVQINGIERCGSPEAAGLRFSPEVAEELRRCLSPSG